MDLLSYLIEVAILAMVIQLGELWMAIGAVLVLIIAARDLKVSILLIISLGVFYLINGIGMKDYWLFAVLALLALGYILGLGKEEAPADPYAGLLGGGMGGMGM